MTKTSFLSLGVLATLILFATLVPSVFSANGIDISMADCPSVTLSQWQCMKNSYGDSFAIIEAFDGGYQINKQIATCVNNAWNAGFSHVDVYAFLCPNCAGNTPASSAVKNLINFLQSNNVKFGMLWFDIEQCTGCWNDVNSNFQFVQECVTAAQSAGISVGIYSSLYEWQQTVGSATGLQNLPLWYAHYDGNPSFSDPQYWQFGGWTTPAIKQYNDSGDSSCGVSVDVDWYPN